MSSDGRSRGHERAIGERDTQQRGLRAADERPVLAGRVIPDLLAVSYSSNPSSTQIVEWNDDRVETGRDDE
jgi:hypothetical protein